MKQTFTPGYRQELIEKCRLKLEQDTNNATTDMEVAMCKAEFKSNLEKIENNINPLEIQRPEDSQFECVGCGS